MKKIERKKRSSRVDLRLYPDQKELWLEKMKEHNAESLSVFIEWCVDTIVHAKDICTRCRKQKP